VVVSLLGQKNGLGTRWVILPRACDEVLTFFLALARTNPFFVGKGNALNETPFHFMAKIGRHRGITQDEHQRGMIAVSHSNICDLISET
jgi:hypothetical protein